MKRFVYLALILVVSFGTIRIVTAQETLLTCDGGTNDALLAAEAAYVAGDFEGALESVAHALTVCAGDNARLEQARLLRREIMRRIEIEAGEPGLVSVGDYSLFLSCMGEGSPTVIFENGWGQSHDTWRDIPQGIAELTRTCTYDRLGHGLSDPYPSGLVWTTQQQVDDLVRLLEAAEIEPPYILVGHSGAGLNVLDLAGRNPDWMAGLMLVDAAVPELFSGSHLYLGANPPTVALNSERVDLDASLELMNDFRPLNGVPLVVITAYASSPIARSEWLELQAHFAANWPKSRQYIAVHSGHTVMDTEPQLIVDGIEWLLEEAR